MSIYERPDLSKPCYYSNFVRVEDVIATGDIQTNLKSLAEKDGIWEKFKLLLSEGSDEIDAGAVAFYNDSFPNITLSGSSDTLCVPKNAKARLKTIALFSAKTPEYNVKNIEDLNDNTGC